MRVFVTGASGGIGSAVVAELIAAGHDVVGLARSDTSARAITASGASVLRGDLDDLDCLRAGAEASDGVIHLAFGHDFMAFEDAIAQDGRAAEAIGSALRGSGKAFVFTSGTPFVPGRPSTEADSGLIDGPAGGRARNAQSVIDLSKNGVRSAVVRLPRSVHSSEGRYGFAGMLIAAAQRTGVSAFVGDGTQRWPAVHCVDAARLYRLTLEHATPGTVVHAVADEGDTMRAIAEVIGRRLGIPTEAASAEQFGFLGTIFGLDQPASSVTTRERFDWHPTHPGLLDNLATGTYPPAAP